MQNLSFNNIFVKYRLCIVCNEKVNYGGTFCCDCYQKIDFISRGCEYCGQPLNPEFDYLEERICKRCDENDEIRLIDGVRSLFLYSGSGKKLVLFFKYRDNHYAIRALLSIFYQLNKDFLYDVDFIMPIPIHWTARLSRGFDQSFLLADELSSIARIKVNKRTLIKHKKTEKQSSQLYKDRFSNIKNSFLLKNNDIINNKNILLVDDVTTTGATAHECAKMLKKRGAKSIKLFTLAKTILPNKYDDL